jgi:hypothetical protein
VSSVYLLCVWVCWLIILCRLCGKEGMQYCRFVGVVHLVECSGLRDLESLHFHPKERAGNTKVSSSSQNMLMNTFGWRGRFGETWGGHRGGCGHDFWIQLLTILLLQVVIIQPQDTGAKSHPFPHAVVAGYVIIPFPDQDFRPP